MLVRETWVLVVSLFFFGSGAGGVATVDGFASRERCEAAAARLKESEDSKRRGGQIVHLTACIQK